MLVEKLPLNKDAEEKLKDGVEDYFWDDKKTRFLDMVLTGEENFKEISIELDVTPGTLKSWLNHPRFMKKYSEAVSETIDSIEQKRKTLEIQRLKLAEEFLEKFAVLLREKMDNLDVSKVLIEFRKLLMLEPTSKSEIKVQQNIDARKQSIQIVSPRARELFEKVVEKQRGFQELEMPEAELKEFQDDKSNFPKSSTGDGRSVKQGIDNQLAGSDGDKNAETSGN